MTKVALIVRLLFLFATMATTAIAAPARIPESDIIARVKQHRAGATGELVKGEEDKRKIILSWNRIAGAEAYEVCHECDIDDDTGSRDGELGTVTPIPITQTCGDRPCMVFPGAPLGYNRFNVRVQVGGEWSAWSKHRNYFVEEIGVVEHEEL